MSDCLDPQLPAHKAPGEEWIVVLDGHGVEHILALDNVRYVKLDVRRRTPGVGRRVVETETTQVETVNELR